MSNYSEALERQVELLRFVSSPQGQRYCREISGSGPDGEWDWAWIAQETLTYAEPFWVSKAIGVFLERSSEGMPAWTLTDEYLPARYGFAWFEQPFDMAPIRAHPGDKYSTSIVNTVQGVAWSRRAVRKSDIEGEVGAVLLVFFGRIQGVSRIVPVAFWWWKIGETHAEAARSFKDGEVTPYRVRRMEYLASTLAFLQQRILVTSQETADRPARRRLSAQGWQQEPLIRVVQLRRRERGDGPAHHEHEVVDWSCQWVVSGHWRQQYFPKAKRRQPKWIMPHLKGPEDKPLKTPRATVFAVVR